MGSAASKTSKAAGAAARQYPKRPAPAAAGSNQAAQQPAGIRPGPTVKPAPRASSSRDAAINLDASDPHFAQQLRNIGPVQPNPTLSATSTFNSGNFAAPTARAANPAIRILESRTKFQEQADLEFAQAGKQGRSLLDAYTIRQILIQRDEHGRSPAQIEKSMGLKPGVVEKLGSKGVIGLITEVGRDRKEIDFV